VTATAALATAAPASAARNLHPTEFRPFIVMIWVLSTWAARHSGSRRIRMNSARLPAGDDRRLESIGEPAKHQPRPAG